VGPAYWPAHRTLRVLAERLAGRGYVAARFDYDGTGDSAGGPADPGRVAAWRASVRAAAEELRMLGAERVALVGVRFGATLCALEAVAAGADAVALVSPVVSGRRFARELSLLGEPEPDGDGRVAGGCRFGAETLAELSALDLGGLEQAPAPSMLLVDAPDTLAEALRARGADVEAVPGSRLEETLDVPPLAARCNLELVEAIGGWLERVLPPTARDAAEAAGRRRAEVAPGLEETFAELGSRRLAAVTTAPAAAARATVVLLNSGGEPHVGPGRAWVELARALAASGYAAVRVDFSGWGESPGDATCAVDPYDAETLADVESLLDGLREESHERIVLLGLCASAWQALEVARSRGGDGVAGVVAINPQLYWDWGDLSEPTIGETHARRAPEMRRQALGARLGLWSLLDVAGARPVAARRLRRLARTGTPVLLLFGERDDGLVYLEDRIGRAFAHARRRGSISVAEIPGLDHPLHRTWLRERVAAEIARFLDAHVAGRG
jgi:alpha-beta hydrolase superfamily lysophospholipase